MRDKQQPKPHEILSAFRGPIQPVRAGIFYSIGMVVAAAALTLLPVLYLALIALLGYGVYEYATGSYAVLVRHGFVGVFLYGAPILAGVISIVFMIKPFFSGGRTWQATMSLRREDEPFLFDFVERVCRLMGAPVPHRIEVDCNINASASFTNR